MSDVAPVRALGFDHTTQGAFAAGAAAAKALGLPAEQIAHAAAIAGTANVALRVIRTGKLSHWKGLAYPHVAKEGTFAALLARQGITGPEEAFEGNKGFKESVSGPFEIDWSTEDLRRCRAYLQVDGSKTPPNVTFGHLAGLNAMVDMVFEAPRWVQSRVEHGLEA